MNIRLYEQFHSDLVPNLWAQIDKVTVPTKVSVKLQHFSQSTESLPCSKTTFYQLNTEASYSSDLM